jgi:thiamine kinase-like enzyme
MRYSKIQKYYPRNEPDLVASHNDLNVRNILYDGHKLWVIDWEAAFQNDRYTDLAITGKAYAAGDEQEENYLRYYFGEALSAYKKARYYLMQQVCHIYYSMIMLKLAAAMQPPESKHNADLESISLDEVSKMIGKG